MWYPLPLTCAVFLTTWFFCGTSSRGYFSCALKCEVVFATYLDLTSFQTQNFMPYLSGLLGIKLIKEQICTVALLHEKSEFRNFCSVKMQQDEFLIQRPVVLQSNKTFEFV